MNYFSSTEFLEPRCPGCDSTLDYGVNTTYQDEHMAHVCSLCRTKSTYVRKTPL